MYVVGRTMGARWENRRTQPEWPVPSLMFDRPYSRIAAWLTAVWPAATVGRTEDFHLSSRVICGGMSSRQVSSVVAPFRIRPGLAAAQPDGVIVHPEQGSSNPKPIPHGSSSGGTVSQIETFHHVFVVERFLM